MAQPVPLYGRQRYLNVIGEACCTRECAACGRVGNRRGGCGRVGRRRGVYLRLRERSLTKKSQDQETALSTQHTKIKKQGVARWLYHT
jgi:hypothetical protein